MEQGSKKNSISNSMEGSHWKIREEISSSRSLHDFAYGRALDM